jgi:hypothetical protein
MPTWFHDGGFPMWITMVFGLLAIGAAARYALQPLRRYLPLVMSLGGMTLVSGAFGLVAGLIKSLRALPQVGPDQRWIWMVGLGESLQNVAFALALVAVATLAVTIGAWRLSRPLED